MRIPTLEVVKIQRTFSPAVWLLVSILFVCSNVKASEALILLSSDTSSYHAVASSLTEHAPDIDFVSRVIDTPDLKVSDYSLLIPVGSQATEFLLRQPLAENSTIISTFLPKARYNQLYLSHKDVLSRQNIRITAVYLDQPISRQLQMAKLIYPELSKLGFTLGDDSEATLAELSKTASRLKIDLNYTELSDRDNPIQKIQPIMEDSDLFLVLPDRKTYNKTTAKWLLYMSFRNRTPLIAFSQNFVRAGAIAAVISTPEDIGRYSAEIITQTTPELLPPPGYSTYFKIITNPGAARKLRFSIPIAENLQQQLLEAEEDD